jgi:hypothetical protein
VDQPRNPPGPDAVPASHRRPGRRDLIHLGVLLIVAAFAHNLFHEFGHWLVGTLLGNPMSMSLNLAWPTSGHYLAGWHAPVVLLGGPGFSILMAAIALVVVMKSGALSAYPFLFFPLYSRAFSLLFGGFDRQDEAAIAAALGIGRYTVAVLVCLILLILVWRGSRRLAQGPRHIGWWCVGAVVAQLAVIGTDRLLR